MAKKDPVLRFEKILVKKFKISPNTIKKIKEQTTKSILRDFKFSENSKLPSSSEISQYLYA